MLLFFFLLLLIIAFLNNYNNIFLYADIFIGFFTFVLTNHKISFDFFS